MKTIRDMTHDEISTVITAAGIGVSDFLREQFGIAVDVVLVMKETLDDEHSLIYVKSNVKNVEEQACMLEAALDMTEANIHNPENN